MRDETSPLFSEEVWKEGLQEVWLSGVVDQPPGAPAGDPTAAMRFRLSWTPFFGLTLSLTGGPLGDEGTTIALDADAVERAVRAIAAGSSATP